MKARLLTLVLLASLVACAQYSLVEVKKQEIGDFYSVEPVVRWSKWTGAAVDYWTVDGPSLQTLHLYRGVKDGEPLRTVPGKGNLPTFSSDMRASEGLEFVVDSFSAYDLNNVDARNLRPANFGAMPGFRFDMRFQSASGLEYDGIAVGTVADGVLYMIIYTGARAHYYPKYLEEVERIIASIETS